MDYLLDRVEGYREAHKLVVLIFLADLNADFFSVLVLLFWFWFWFFLLLLLFLLLFFLRLLLLYRGLIFKLKYEYLREELIAIHLFEQPEQLLFLGFKLC